MELVSKHPVFADFHEELCKRAHVIEQCRKNGVVVLPIASLTQEHINAIHEFYGIGGNEDEQSLTA